MDAGRFCYKAPCQFLVGGPVAEIHWYWATEEAAVYLQPHAFPRMAGYRQFKITDRVGERFVQFPRHVSGVAPPGVEEITPDGTPQQFLGEGVFGPIIWGNLPNCRLPVAFLDNDINIDAAITFRKIIDGITFDAAHTFAESATISFDAPDEEETAADDLVFSVTGEPGEKAVLHFDANIKTNAQTAAVEIDTINTFINPPALPTWFEVVTLQLFLDSKSTSPPAGESSAEVWLDDEKSWLEQEQITDVDFQGIDDGYPPGEHKTVILIGAGEEPAGSGSGSGSTGGPGGACEDAQNMDNGVEYTQNAFGHADQWFKFWLPAGWTADIAYRTNSGADRSISWYHGSCDDLHLIRGTFVPLITFPYGPAIVSEWIIAYVNNFNGDANFTVRITAS